MRYIMMGISKQRVFSLPAGLGPSVFEVLGFWPSSTCWCELAEVLIAEAKLHEA